MRPLIVIYHSIIINHILYNILIHMDSLMLLLVFGVARTGTSTLAVPSMQRCPSDAL